MSIQVQTYTGRMASEGCLVSDRLTNDGDINQTVFQEPVRDMRRPGHKHCEERPLLSFIEGQGKPACIQLMLIFMMNFILEHYCKQFLEGPLTGVTQTYITNGMQDPRPCIKECWGKGYFMGPLSAAPLTVGQSNDLVAFAQCDFKCKKPKPKRKWG